MDIGFSPTQGGQAYDHLLAQARFADRNGLASLFLQEHHESTVMSWPDPLTALAGVATTTESLQLGTAVLLAPLYHPVRLAERGAMLDGLSEGRFVLGAGLGYRDRDFDVMSVDRRRRGALLEEYLTFVSRAWREESVTFDGTTFDVAMYTCSPRPHRQPRPRIWIGGYHPTALDRAARMIDEGIADAWIPGTQPDFDGLVTRADHFEVRARAYSVDPSSVERPVLRDGIIAPTMSEAENLATEYVWPTYQKLYGEHAGADSSNRLDLGVDIVGAGRDPATVVKGRAIVGDPDEWVDQLQDYASEIGIDHVVVRLWFPGMSHERVMMQLRLLSREVIPRV